MRCKKLTIIVPVYNEITTLQSVYDALVRLDLACEKELIFVDDYSSDGSREILKDKARQAAPNERYVFHEKNRGKGAAIRTALPIATGDYVLVCDADFEYDPSDIQQLIACVEREYALVVYGSRNKNIHNRYNYWHYYVGGWVITFLFNGIFGQKVSDMNTCFKLIARPLLLFIELTEDGFGIEAEISAKVARLGVPIIEVPIRYTPRKFSDGKKIRTRDGIRQIGVLIRYGMFDLQFGLLDRLIRFARTSQLRKMIHPGDTLVDFGCGRQAYIGWKYRTVVDRYIGLDRTIPQLSIENLSFFNCRIDELPQHLPSGSISTIIALALIEHLDDPQPFLSVCLRLLKKGGQLILTTPPPRAKPILELIAALHLIDKREIDDHKHYFSPQELMGILAESGFSEIRTTALLGGWNRAYTARKEVDHEPQATPS